MKYKDKISFLKNEIKSETPEINIKYVLSTANIKASPSTSLSSPMLHRKFILRTAFCSILIILVSVIILLGGSLKTNLDRMPESDASYDFNSNAQLYGFLAVSIVSIIDQNQELLGNASNSSNDLLVNNEIIFLNRHMYLMEIIIGSSSDVKFIQTNSDDNKYDNLVVFNNYDSFNQLRSFKIYFNEIIDNQNIIKIDMLVKHNSENYYIQGSKQTVNNNILLEFTSINENSNDYVKATNIISSTTNEFGYMIVANDMVLSKSKLALYIENEEIYAILENSLLSLGNNLFTIYKNNSQININYQISLAISEQAPSDDFDNMKPSNPIENGNIVVTISSESHDYSYNITSNNQSFVFTQDRAQINE